MTDPYHRLNVSARVHSMRQWLDQQPSRPSTPASMPWIRLMDQQLKDNNLADREQTDYRRISFEAELVDARRVIERDGLFPDGWDTSPLPLVTLVR